MLVNRRARLALALALLWLSGCPATVFPPDDVADPAGVGVLDHGRHASLIVEVPGDGMLRYAYGDWDWYALRQTGAVEASAAVLWPTQGALGRMWHPGPFSPTAVSRELRVAIEHAIYLTVDAREVRRFVDRLDRVYESGAPRIYNAAYDLVFVPYPQAYWIFHNSNQVVGKWLEQLECRVEGPTLFSIWKLGTDQ